MKKAFTLIELLLVVSIVWLLIYSIRWFFSYKDVEHMKFDTCYIHTYWKVTNFMQEALLQKMYFYSGEYRKIKLYSINFDVSNQKVDFIYSWDNKKYINSIVYSGEWVDRINDCYTTTYVTKLTWTNLRFDINPGLQRKYEWESSVKMFSWWNMLALSSSWNVIFSYCEDKAWKHCKQKYKLSILPWVYVAKSFFCKTIDKDWICIDWR